MPAAADRPSEPFPERSRSRTEEIPAMSATVTMYSTPWCGYCRRLKSQMEREGLAYTEVDIEQDAKAAEYVMSVNGGNQTVPTVVLVDASGAIQWVATNPSLAQVKAAVAEAAA
jgi:mycoredoxin